jgi:hypothetical protein
MPPGVKVKCSWDEEPYLDPVSVGIGPSECSTVDVSRIHTDGWPLPDVAAVFGDVRLSPLLVNNVEEEEVQGTAASLSVSA